MSPIRRPRERVRKRAPAFLVFVVAVVAGCGADDSGPRLLVTSTYTDEVIALDPADGRVVRRVAVDPRPDHDDVPSGTVVVPSGEHWGVVTGGEAAEFWLFDRGERRPRVRVPLGLRAAGRPGIDPAGRRVVVPEYWLGDATPGGGAVIDLADGSRTSLPPHCAAPHQAAFSPDGRWLAVPCALDDVVLLLDAATLEVRHRVALSPAADGAAPDAPDPASLADAPATPLAQPLNVAWAPDSGRLWATLFRAGAVVAIDTAGVEVGRAPVRSGPADLTVTPDGRRLLVTLRNDFLVAVLDALTLEQTGRIVVADAPNPHGVVVSPDGATAYIAHEGTARSPGGVTAIQIADGRVVWHHTGGAFTLDLRWFPGASP